LRSIGKKTKRLGCSDLEWFGEQLMRLHAQRRQAIGDPGIFADPVTAAFHQDVLPQLLNAGSLHLSLLELDGEPVAAEYLLRSRSGHFAYQSGIDPRASEHSPGSLSLAATVEHAIASKAFCFDFLRGDESYKSSWGAQLHPAICLQVRRANLRGYPGHWNQSVRAALRDLRRCETKPADATTSRDSSQEE
jgi:CelD/BcsL family acetyltransferase involved in cellulose biosynthesis